MAELRAPHAQMSDQELLQAVVGFYHRRLQDYPPAQEFLRKRGLADSALIDHFQLGFADRELGRAIPTKACQAGRQLRERLTRLGIYRASGHGQFNGCLVVPIFGPEGDVREIYGRKINSNLRKGTRLHVYLNDPPCGVWNSGALASTDTVILCKSLIDGLTFWSAGIRNVTSNYGYNPLSQELLDAIEGHGIRRVLLAYEQSDRGDAAAEQVAIQLESRQIETSRIELPRGLDVNALSLSVDAPADALAELVQWAQVTARPAQQNTPAPDSHIPPPAPKDLDIEQTDTEVIIRIDDRRWRARGLEKQLSHERLKVNLMVSRLDGVHVDTFDLYSARHRAAFVNQAAGELYMDETILKQELGRVLLALEQLQDELIRQTLTPAEEPAPEMDEAGRSAALDLLNDPRLLDRIIEDLDKCGVVGEETNKLIGYLATTSRKLDRPLAVLIQSSSAAGKTSLMEGVLALMPPEEQVKYSAITGQSLFYMGQQNLKHKILALAEEEGTQQASYALKLLQSEGVLRIAATGRSRDNGRMETEDYVVEGPTMLFLTTTAVNLDEELTNRCLVLTVDEAQQQTRAIQQRQRGAETLDGVLQRRQRDKILQLHQNAQRLLRPLLVVNPLAEQLTYADRRIRTRRDHVKYLTLIRTVTLLHQYQRTVQTMEYEGEAVEYIEVTEEDIKTADRLAAEVLDRDVDDVPPQTRRLLSLINDLLAHRSDLDQATDRFTRRQLREATCWGNTQLKMHLRRLVDLEYLAVHRTNSGLYWYESLYDVPHYDRLFTPHGEYDDSRSGQTSNRSERGRPLVGPRSAGGRPSFANASSNGPLPNRTSAVKSKKQR